MNTYNKCLYAIILYIILIILILMINPRCCYYNIEKTKLKDWNLFLETRDYNDVITLPFIFVVASILSYSLTCFK